MTSPDHQPNAILEILRKRGLLSGTSVRTVAGFMAKWSIDAYHAVLETHVVDEVRLADILSEEFKLPRISRIRSIAIDRDALNYLDYDRAMAWEMLPFRFGDEGDLHVLIADPTNVNNIEYLKSAWGKPIKFFIGERTEIEVATQRRYPLSMQLPLTMKTCESST